VRFTENFAKNEWSDLLKALLATLSPFFQTLILLLSDLLKALLATLSPVPLPLTAPALMQPVQHLVSMNPSHR
jgi:hypothetical protein